MDDNTRMIQRLEAGDREVLLLGTAHVSKESAALAEELIVAERPDTVCVELCQARYQALRQRENWQNTDIVRVIREKKALLLLSNLLLASVQNRIARKLGIRPGQEMLAAVEAAEDVGARIHLADRDIRITLSRTWRSMTLWSRLKLLGQFLLSLGDAGQISEAEIEKMKQQDVLATLLAEVGKSQPALKQILIDERDRYLARKIRQAPGRKIVAVVGAGHVPGIKAHWNIPVDTAALEEVPPKGKLLRVLKWLLPALIVGVLITGFFQGGAHTGGNMLAWWIFINAVLAGLGAVVALAHPLTIMAAVAAAPLTSLNPMIAAGWVSGLVEACTRKPKVKDFEHLQEDIHSLRGFWRNKVTRILLVIVFTNLGSSAGTFIALPLMVKLL